MFQFKTQQIFKEVQHMMYGQVLNEKNKNDQQINLLQTQLKQFPEGKLICSQSGKHSKWYISDGKNKTYLPKKERSLAEKLALKKYLSLQLANLQQEQIAINFYLRHYNPNTFQKEVTLFNSPGYKELLSKFFTPTSKDLVEWMNLPYEKCTKHLEKLVHKTHSGNLVRSKSEAIIDMFLYKNKIPFRYECELVLDEVVLYPDFTIRHPKTGEIFYWEHFGLMDDSSYCKNVLSKLQIYISNGIIPTIQLITTYETKDHPLNMEQVEKIVKQYFC